MTALKGRALKRESRPACEGGRPHCEKLTGTSQSHFSLAAYRPQLLIAHAIQPELAVMVAPFYLGGAGHD